MSLEPIVCGKSHRSMKFYDVYFACGSIKRKRVSSGRYDAIGLWKRLSC